MPDEMAPLRRKPSSPKSQVPSPKSLSEDIRHLLVSIGLPGSDTDERARAHGIVVTEAEGDAAFVEWFIPRTLREAAAIEQREADDDENGCQ
ncbi:hypothetical protein [Streptomyces sp. CB02923]|uniref:hypothetical protein n=1 Tax=Streptomyces sp. CB02923 TaxID=1718985 RepID=UPI0018FF138E|nr:hypothetical protein [Streptomyces sp. CB02923]